jgi:hypothetical protein
MILRTIFFAFSLVRVGAFSNAPSKNFDRFHPSDASNQRTALRVVALVPKESKTIQIGEYQQNTHTGTPTRTRKRLSTKLFSTRNRNKPTAGSNNGVTSTLISQLAVVALKIRLTKHSGVSCDVTASSKNLFLNSSIGPVTVRGRGWSSPLGLTCRAIDATVETCTLDMNSVVRKRKLILITPAVGKAMVALNPKDFGSFLTHPLLTAPSLSLPLSNANAVESQSQSREQFEFSGDDVEISHENGVVVFYGTCIGEKWRCELMRGENGSKRAEIQVSRVPSSVIESTSSAGETQAQEGDVNFDSIELELSTVVQDFFNDLVFELDGTFLSFQDMKVHRPKDNGEANVLMALGITVKKFPSPGLAF